MALTAATLTTTISETVTLNGKTYGNTNIKKIQNVKVVREFTLTVPQANETTIYETADDPVSASSALIDEDTIVYSRITNLDTTNFINLVLKNVANDEFQYKLEAGKSLVLGTHDGFDAAAGAVTIGSNYSPIHLVTAKADTADVDVEVFIAATG